MTSIRAQASPEDISPLLNFINYNLDKEFEIATDIIENNPNPFDPPDVNVREVRQSEEQRTAGAKRQQKQRTTYLYN